MSKKEVVPVARLGEYKTHETHLSLKSINAFVDSFRSSSTTSFNFLTFYSHLFID